MFAKLVLLFSVLALALARPQQLYSGYGYGGYASGYPGLYGYNPTSYGSYGTYGSPYTAPYGYGINGYY